MKRNDNRGASFVMVIVAMAIVAVLAVTVLWIALMNLQMKVTDEKNTDNFYSAEGVLDQICTGLQSDISKAYSAGYTKVMENYSDSSINEAGRQSNFAQEYLKSLKMSLESDSTGMKFNMEKLKQYVDPKLLEEKNQPHAIIKSTNADENGNGKLKVYQNRVVLNGLRVEYTDEKGFKSIIETDISLGVPSMSFTASGGVPELFTYSLVGNEGLEIKSGLNKVNLSGNLYAGCENAAGTGNSTTSVSIPNNATLDVKDTSYMIAEGDIEVGDFAGKNTATIKKNMAGVQNNSKLSVDSQCQLWTGNINVNGATVSLDGMTYVADDMTLKGTGSKVTLGKNNKNNNAKYVGFGNGGADKENPVAGDSSAIIINGRDASLDMSNIRELMLAGTAYINTQAIVNSSGVGTENSNVAMGESISVKGDQIAYLVPPECIGTSGDGADAKSLYNKNPLSYKEYKDITATGQDQTKYTEINVNVVSTKTGKALLAYLPKSKTIDKCIKKVFVPSTDNKDDGLVYYYVNLPTNKAAEYYSDYFGADSDKLRRYTRFYTDSIQVNEAASIYTAGNYSIYDGSNLSLLKGIADGVDMDAQSDALQRTYTALNSKLLTNYADLPANAASVSLFTNIVNNENLEKIVPNFGDKQIFATEYQGTKYQAIVKNGDYTYDEKEKSHNVDIIVATGNVTLEADFTGTIVAKGRIIVNKEKCEIDNGTQELFKALLLEKVSDADDALHLYDVFMDGANYLGNVSSFSNKKVADTKIDYATLITYQNWTKE
ncbi:hypothetical protein [Agathobacter sp.]|uniref:hypothetical protein n=1 Tax=Agathobacter sp. TaxID=2021311 RepID=UPI003FD797AE